jgi:hypothetical protein
MKAISEIDLNEAFRKYAISNTPIFLMKMLRADSATLDISTNYQGEEILAAFKSAVGNAPHDSADYVRPYVYIVALSQLPEVRFLQEAMRLKGIERWDWLPYVGSVLIDTYAPYQATTIPAPQILIGPSIRGSDDPVEFETIELAGAHS